MKKGFAALMQRVGILEKTVDPAFEEEREAWKAFQSEANEVLVALRRQADATKAAVAPLQAVDNALRDVYGESHAAYITWQKAFVTASSSLLVFLEEQKKEVDAVAEHIGAVAALKQDIVERDAKLLDVDRAHAALEKAQQSGDPAKLQHADDKHRALREAYDNTNAAVMQRMKEARLQRPFRFDNHVRAALAAQLRFSSTTAAAFRVAENFKPPSKQPQQLASAAAAVAAAHGGSLPQPPASAPPGATPPPRPPKDSTVTSATTTTTAAAPAAVPQESTAVTSAAKLGVLVLPTSTASAAAATTTPPPAATSTSASAPAQQNQVTPSPAPATPSTTAPPATPSTKVPPATPATQAPEPPKPQK